MFRDRMVAMLGMVELMILLTIMILGVVPVVGAIDAAMISDHKWAASAQNKLVWVIVQLALGIIGTLVYLVAIRPKVQRAHLLTDTFE